MEQLSCVPDGEKCPVRIVEVASLRSACGSVVGSTGGLLSHVAHQLARQGLSIRQALASHAPVTSEAFVASWSYGCCNLNLSAACAECAH